MSRFEGASCEKCNGPVDRHAYVIGYCRDTAMTWIYLCGGCEAGLREWLTESVTDEC